MKRFHVHVGVTDLNTSIRFYSALFGAQPSVLKQDYAKWMLDDPRINFAISTRSGRAGLDHLGLQAENSDELAGIEVQLKHASNDVLEQKNSTCCYAASDKYWVQDPAGIPWEAFHTLGSVPVFAEETASAQSACCSPALEKTHCC